MVSPTVLVRVGWLAVVAGLLAFASCRDFDAAYEDACVTNHLCYEEGEDAGTEEDAGTDGGTIQGNDAGTDGGTTQGNDAGTDGGLPPGNDAGTDGGIPPGPDGGPDAGNPDGDGGMDGGSDGGEPDAGDAGPDAGPDGGPSTFPPDASMSIDGNVSQQVLELNECAAGLCLRHEYTVSGPYELQGLWGSSPDDVFLAARARPEVDAPAQVVRFQDGSFSASTVNLPGFQPFRLQGTDDSNVWAINEAPAAGPCWLGNEAYPEAQGGPLMHCPSPLFRFDGWSWAPVEYVTNGRTTIQPPALYTGPDTTWVASSGDGVLRWTGTLWQQEPALAATGDQLSALWGDRSGLRLGVGRDSYQRGAFRQLTPSGAWLRSPNLEREPFVTVAGPDEQHLYAATPSEVLRWMPEAWWQPEARVPALYGEAPAVQDLWVSADGSDVWVTLKASYVLRKHGGQWSVIRLPVAPGFSALQVEGFDTPAGDLWITGTWTSGEALGTSAYHYERQEP